MEYIEINRVTKKDIKLLQEIGRKTFFETYSASNTEENMARYLEEDLSIETLTNELNSERSEFYFALINDKVIGYLKLNLGQSQTDLQDNNALEIERIYVLREHQGKKAGQVLYEKAMEVAGRENVHYVWLGVWEKNPRAIGFYNKNGFIEFDKHNFRLGDEEQTDIMMKKVLKVNY